MPVAVFLLASVLSMQAPEAPVEPGPAVDDARPAAPEAKADADGPEAPGEPAVDDGKPLLAGLGAAGAACGALVLASLATWACGVVPMAVAGAIPTVGWVLSLAFGAGALFATVVLVGAGAKLGASVAGSRRIPLLWPALVGLGGIVAAGVVGWIFSVMAAVVSVGGTMGVYLAILGARLGNGGMVAAGAGAAVVGYSLTAIVVVLGVLAASTVVAALLGGIGVVAAKTGRGRAPGEPVFSLDVVRVPPPDAPGNGGDDEEEDEAAARRGR